MAQLLTCAAQGNEHYTGETHNLHASVVSCRPLGVAEEEKENVHSLDNTRAIFPPAVHRIFFKHHMLITGLDTKHTKTNKI